MKFSYTKNTESDFFNKESKSNKKNKKNSGGWEGRGWGGGGGGGGGRVSDLVFLFSKEFKSE